MFGKYEGRLEVLQEAKQILQQHQIVKEILKGLGERTKLLRAVRKV
jgi:hypothetical protein